MTNRIKGMLGPTKSAQQYAADVEIAYDTGRDTGRREGREEMQQELAGIQRAIHLDGYAHGVRDAVLLALVGTIAWAVYVAVCR